MVKQVLKNEKIMTHEQIEEYRTKKTYNQLQNPLLFRFGLFLAILHILCVIYVIAEVLADKPLGELIWLLLGYIDFPLSLLYGKVLHQIIPEFNIDFLNVLPHAMGSFLFFWLPVLFHGLIGTLWFFFLPYLIYKITKWLSTNRFTAVINGVLFLFPMLCSWLELLYECVFDSYKFLVFLHSGLISTWLALIIILLFQKIKKPVLFHLCFLPFVVWFLARDIILHYHLHESFLYNLFMGYP